MEVRLRGCSITHYCLLVVPENPDSLYADVQPRQYYTSTWTMDIPVEKIKTFSVEWTDKAVIEMEKKGISIEFKDPIVVNKVIFTPIYDESAPRVSFCNKEGVFARPTKRMEMKQC